MSSVGGDRTVSEVQRVLTALSSPIRREILWRIWDEELPAGAVAAAFQVTSPTISEHLAVLRDAGLVTVRRSGNRRYYRAVHDAVAGLPERLADEGSKWVPADDLPERERATARTGSVVTASVEVPVDRDVAFTAFTDPALYGRWLGVPVTLQDGRFACTLEWGTRVRGRYEHTVRPWLIAMRWDFDDERVPLPGAGLVCYLRLSDVPAGCHVEVHQLVDTPQQAHFMEAAWTFVLGRLEAGIADAATPGATETARPTRPKRLGT